MAFNFRGISYNKKGDHDRAISDYNEAIRLNPKFEVRRRPLYRTRCGIGCRTNSRRG
jgi:tetratricopeptide (TPR) repeat protein